MERTNPNQDGQSRQQDYDQFQVDNYNQTAGNLKDYDCEVCNNKGFIMKLKDGFQVLHECQCMKVRRSITIIKKSGLEKVMNDYTFHKFTPMHPWQEHMKKTATSFLGDTLGNWFFAGGQPGSGKTHICTAIVGELMKRGNEALYMKWRDDSVGLKKALVSDGHEYSDDINRYKNIKVLYIDDFFKTERGKAPTAADINLAFEILNHRYNNRDLITIISSERFIDELLEYDEAIGSRIYQMSKKYCIEISNDRSKNVRLMGGTR